jgi:hypothetical protein
MMAAAALAVSDATLVEGNAGSQYAALNVSLSTPSAKTVQVNYNTADGTAKAGSDYKAVSGTLTFASGETRKSILIPVQGDRLAEINENFFVNLRAAKGANIADGQGAVSIVDNEPRISITDAWGPEGDSGTTPFTFTVRLSAAYDQAITVNFATADGSARLDDWAGPDYVATSGTLTFAPGETTKTITVHVVGDTVFESSSTQQFYVNLSGASTNALLIDNQGVGSIWNDEAQEYVDPYWDGYGYVDPCLFYNCHPDGGGYDGGEVNP